MNDSSPLRELEVAIVGAGFGGLCMGMKLLEAGIREFVILEKDSEVGGTWRDNNYPGAACDVQSHFYSYSFDGKPDWSMRYAGWEEIQRYILDTTARHGLRSHVRFGEAVNSTRFDQANGRWDIATRSGTRLTARHLVLATGPLHVPQIPKIPGLESFKGKVFHSARWDHAYELDGKRVASIGTGGSAIQYCPEIAPRVSRLHVFQRTPAWVMRRDLRTYSDRRKRRYGNLPWLRTLHRWQLYWTNESRLLGFVHPALVRLPRALALRMLRRQVADPALVAALTPDYTFGCKRVLISNTWYPMFNRPNVELVTQGIREVSGDCIVTDGGVARPVDCIILGTGFVVDPRIYMRDFVITGLNGRKLSDDWRDGAQAYYGVHVTGYPNLHQLVGPNTGLGHNSVIFMIEAQVHYVLESIRAVRNRGAACINVRPQMQARFNERLQQAFRGTVWSSGCTSWYRQADGTNFSLWPWATWRYWLQTRRVDAASYDFIRLDQPTA